MEWVVFSFFLFVCLFAAFVACFGLFVCLKEEDDDDGTVVFSLREQGRHHQVFLRRR